MERKRSWMFGVLFLFAGAVCLSMISQAPAGDRRQGRRSVPGRVTHVNTADHRISLEVGTIKKPNRRTFSVAKDANITVNGRAATLSGVKAGMHATLRLNRARHFVVRIHAHNV